MYQKTSGTPGANDSEAGCSQEESPKKRFVMGSRTQGVQDSRCPGNIRRLYIGCPHPHKPEPGEGTHGTGPFRPVLGSNSFAANP